MFSRRASASASSARAPVSSACPAAVGSTPRRARRKSSAPSSRSSSATARETVEWLIYSSAAAPVKLPRSAAAQNILSFSSSMPLSS